MNRVGSPTSDHSALLCTQHLKRVDPHRPLGRQICRQRGCPEQTQPRRNEGGRIARLYFVEQRGQQLRQRERATGAQHQPAQRLPSRAPESASRLLLMPFTQIDHMRHADIDEPLRVDAEPGEPPDDPGNSTVNFHGESRRNDTHQSTTDGEAMLHKKGRGKEAKLAYLGHVLLDNRDGLVANACVTHAPNARRRRSCWRPARPPGSTVGADKGYDVASCVAAVRGLAVTPHVAQKARLGSADRAMPTIPSTSPRTSRHDPRKAPR